jgi:hypothetical protein
VIDSGREPDDGSLVLAVDGGQASFREWREGSDGYCWGVVARVIDRNLEAAESVA